MFLVLKTPCLNIRLFCDLEDQLAYKQFYLSHRFLFPQMDGIWGFRIDYLSNVTNNLN